MAQINITPTRLKQDTTISLDEDICAVDTSGTQVTAEAVSATEIAIPLVIESLPSDIFGADGSITADSPGGAGSTIQFTNLAGDVSNVQIGDLAFGVNVTANVWNSGGADDDPTSEAVPGDEDFTDGQGTALSTGAYVSAIDTVGNTIDITVGAGSALVDQTLQAGTELAFRRNGIKVTLAHLGVRITSAGSNISLTTVVYQHDGTLAADGSSQDSYDGLTAGQAQSNTVQSAVTIPYDTFLTNARVARTNT